MTLCVLSLSFAIGCAPDRLQAVELRPDSLRNNLLSHWAFDDAAGSSARNDSDAGSRLDGQLTGNRTWLGDGRFGGALRLAEGEYVSVQDFPGATSGYTASAWVRFPNGVPGTSDRWTTVVSTEDSGGWEINVAHDTTPPSLHFGFWIGPSSSDYEGFTCTGKPLDHWSHVAFAIDTTFSTVTVYRDGAPCFAGTTDHQILPGSKTLTIGSWPFHGRYLAGDVDDIAIWGRALEPAEVALLFSSPP